MNKRSTWFNEFSTLKTKNMCFCQVTICPSTSPRKLQVVEGILNMILWLSGKLSFVLVLRHWIHELTQARLCSLRLSDGWGLQVGAPVVLQWCIAQGGSKIDEVHLAQVRRSLAWIQIWLVVRFLLPDNTSLDLGEILKLQEVLEWPSFIHVSSVVCSFIISSEGFYGQILTLFVKILLTSFQQYDDDLCPLGSLTWLDLPEPYLLLTLVNKVTIHL